ncbi:MAG TPA: EpsI family protein [Opitutaceae bacterium]|nr:EpsI family protein [Opitutaceae bacterium]
MLAGLGLHAVGFAAQQARVSIIALLVFAWGVLHLGGGRRWGRAAVFPVAFLVFAIPLNALDSVGFWLRLWVINSSAWLAHHAGIGVLQNGTQLVAPDGRYSYDVAAACSGIRSLMALAALSLLMGYLYFRSWWRRAVVLLFCFPLVYVGNVTRISSIVFAAQVGGTRWGDVAHEVMGYAIFLIVLGGALAVAAGLDRLVPESTRIGGQTTEGGERRANDESQKAEGNGATPQAADDGESRGEGTAPKQFPREGETAIEADRTAQAAGNGDRAHADDRTDRGVKPPVQSRATRSRVWIGAGLVVAIAAGEGAFLHRVEALPLRGTAGVVLTMDGRNPVELPSIVGRSWFGLPAPVTAIERQILPPDTGYSRADYVAARDGHHVFLSIVLSGRDRTSIHRPELCLVGQGWTIRGRERHRFAYPGHPDAAFPATILRVRREVSTPTGKVSVPQLVAYWFVGGDRVVATHWHRLAVDAWNRVVHGRADRWAYVLLQTDAVDGEPAALARMQAILDGTLPAFQRPLPN